MSSVPPSAPLQKRPPNLWAGLLLASALFLFPLLFLPLAGATDAGVWQPVGLRGETMLSLAVAGQGDETILYAETPMGLWRSVVRPSAERLQSDAWQRIDADLPHTPLGAPDVAAWRNVPGRPLQLYALAGARDARQLYRTDDGGASWQPVGPAPGQSQSPAMIVLPGEDLADTILIATPMRVQRSLDGGATWAPGGQWPEAATGSDDPVVELLAETGAPQRLLALARSGGLWISENGGLSWHDTGARQDIRTVALEPYSGLRVWAAGDAGAAASADGGVTWSEFSLPGESGVRSWSRSDCIAALEGDPRVAETVYAAVRDGAVYRSDHGGQDWQFLGAPGSAQIAFLALEQDHRSILYAATDDGIWARRVTPLEPTPTPAATETSIPIDTPAATETVRFTPAPAATQTPTLTSTPTATMTGTATSSPTSSATMSPTASRTARATARPARRPTLTPTATRTPTIAPIAPPAGAPGFRSQEPPAATQPPAPTPGIPDR